MFKRSGRRLRALRGRHETHGLRGSPMNRIQVVSEKRTVPQLVRFKRVMRMRRDSPSYWYHQPRKLVRSLKSSRPLQAGRNAYFKTRAGNLVVRARVLPTRKQCAAHARLRIGHHVLLTKTTLGQSGPNIARGRPAVSRARIHRHHTPPDLPSTAIQTRIWPEVAAPGRTQSEARVVARGFGPFAIRFGHLQPRRLLQRGSRWIYGLHRRGGQGRRVRDPPDDQLRRRVRLRSDHGPDYLRNVPRRQGVRVDLQPQQQSDALWSKFTVRAAADDWPAAQRFVLPRWGRRQRSRRPRAPTQPLLLLLIRPLHIRPTLSPVVR